jgi:hypothetical protein
MMNCPFERRVEDLGNIVALEHLNVAVAGQQKATLFYVAGLGLTRDPFLVTSTRATRGLTSAAASSTSRQTIQKCCAVGLASTCQIEKHW